MALFWRSHSFLFFTQIGVEIGGAYPAGVADPAAAGDPAYPVYCFYPLCWGHD